jgi:ppGpp synthetase/RelA/SpoT-type nucleotidyltranferase
MPDRTVEDLLREQYFDLLPEIRKVIERLESEVRFHLLSVRTDLHKFEIIEVRARVKQCESALDSLRRRQEGTIFDQNRPSAYSLTNLKDLAAVRVLAFPHSRVTEIDSVLRLKFPLWHSDPVVGDSGKVLAHKYSGYTEESNKIAAEYQVVSMLTGLFWEIEHSALYKPAPRLKGLARSLEMRERSEQVYIALNDFAVGFEHMVRDHKKKKKKKKGKPFRARP